MLKVEITKHWGKDSKGMPYLGITDGMVMYCSTGDKCYLVKVHALGYIGYFKTADLKVISAPKYKITIKGQS